MNNGKAKETETQAQVLNGQQRGALIRHTNPPLAKYNKAFDSEQEITLNVGDVKKFLRVLDCVEEDELVFKIESNHLHYKTDKLQFKYHFLDDSVV